MERICEYKHCDNIVTGRKDKRYCRVYCKQYAKDSRLQRVKDRKREHKKAILRPYLKFKKPFCEICNFVPVHSCQLDVDHINGDHYNNEESNLQTLCANCHRLKTYMNKDWLIKK